MNACKPNLFELGWCIGLSAPKITPEEATLLVQRDCVPDEIHDIVVHGVGKAERIVDPSDGANCVEDTNEVDSDLAPESSFESTLEFKAQTVILFLTSLQDRPGILE